MNILPVVFRQLADEEFLVPRRIRHLNQAVNVENQHRMPLNDRRAENALLLERFGVNMRVDFHRINNFLHDQPDLFFHRKHNQRESRRIRRRRNIKIILKAQQRENLVAILHDLPPAGIFDLRR